MADEYLDSLNDAIKLNALALADATTDSEIDTYYGAIYNLESKREVHFRNLRDRQRNLQEQQKKAALDGGTSKAAGAEQ
jgi:hypothetical protein